jgi:tripartite-type tricarboxylate transporter receptor subunit TctC
MQRRSLLLATPALLLGSSTLAEGLPGRPITIIVPYPAGGPADAVARLVAEVMARDLAPEGVPGVVVENVSGAGGTIGTARVAQARPDSTTLLIHHLGHAASATLYRKLPYDVEASFAPIGLINDVPMVICSRPGFPAKDLNELIAMMKARGTEMTMANSGLGGTDHLGGMLLQREAGTQITAVSFRGSAPATTEVIAGRIDLFFGQTTSTVAHIRAGRMKAYALTAPQRSPFEGLAEVPTVVEQGHPGLLMRIWQGILAPKGTPEAAQQRLSRSIQVALRDEKLLARFHELATEAVPQDQATPAYFTGVLAEDVARWRPIIQAAGQYAD